MSEPDFKHLSLDELKAMQDKLSQFVDRKLEAKKKEALNQIRKIVQDHDLSYEEVIQVIRANTRRGKAPAIYRNPNNPRQTWSGKGEPPIWYVQHSDPEKLRIPGA